MIAKKRTEKLQPSITHASRCPQGDVAIRVLEVAGHGARAEVYPAPEHGVSDKTIVPFIRMTNHHRRREFAMDAAVVANRRSRNTIGHDRRAAADVTRTNDTGKCLDDRTIAQ